MNPPEISGPSAVATFIEGIGGRLPDPATSFSELFRDMDAAVRHRYGSSRSLDQALSKIHGDWYEFLLNISAHNTHVKTRSRFIAVNLPNKARFNCEQLYLPKFSMLVTDLRAKVENAAGVVLISSNPDFALVRADRSNVSEPLERISDVTIARLASFADRYTNFIQQCGFADIAGYLGAKFTLKPDRRLQLAHEGSLMKALYVHLQTREWELSPPGIRYYAATTRATPADLRALKTVATHSITTVTSEPQRAVDELFVINCMADADEMFGRIYSLSEMLPEDRAANLSRPAVSGIVVDDLLDAEVE